MYYSIVEHDGEMYVKKQNKPQIHICKDKLLSNIQAANKLLNENAHKSMEVSNEI